MCQCTWLSNTHWLPDEYISNLFCFAAFTCHSFPSKRRASSPWLHSVHQLLSQPSLSAQSHATCLPIQSLDLHKTTADLAEKYNHTLRIGLLVGCVEWAACLHTTVATCVARGCGIYTAVKCASLRAIFSRSCSIDCSCCEFSYSVGGQGRKRSR